MRSSRRLGADVRACMRVKVRRGIRHDESLLVAKLGAFDAYVCVCVCVSWYAFVCSVDEGMGDMRLMAMGEGPDFV